MKAKIISGSLAATIVLMLVGSIFSITALGAEKITLRIWGTASNLRDRARAMVFTQFQIENPELRVDFEGIPWPQYNDKIITAIAMGNPPDVARYSFTARFASKGVLVNLDEYIAGPDGVDLDAYVDGVPGPGQMWDGKVYALPFGMVPHVLFYNAPLLAGNGLEAPKTWEEFASAAKKLTKKSASGDILQRGFQFNYTPHYIADWLGANGGRISDKLGHDATKAVVDSPENAEALEFLRDLFMEGYGLKTAEHGVERAFVDGESAMWWTESNSGYAFRPELQPDFQWKVTPIPIPAGKPQIYPGQSSDAAFMFEASENKDAAWKLLKAYAGKSSTGLIWFWKFGEIPPYKDVLDPETDTGAFYIYQSEPRLKGIAEIAIKPMTVIDPFYWHLAGVEIDELQAKSYEAILTGKVPAKEELGRLQKQLEKFFPEK